MDKYSPFVVVQSPQIPPQQNYFPNQGFSLPPSMTYPTNSLYYTTPQMSMTPQSLPFMSSMSVPQVMPYLQQQPNSLTIAANSAPYMLVQPAGFLPTLPAQQSSSVPSNTALPTGNWLSTADDLEHRLLTISDPSEAAVANLRVSHMKRVSHVQEVSPE